MNTTTESEVDGLSKKIKRIVYVVSVITSIEAVIGIVVLGLLLVHANDFESTVDISTTVAPGNSTDLSTVTTAITTTVTTAITTTVAPDNSNDPSTVTTAITMTELPSDSSEKGFMDFFKDVTQNCTKLAGVDGYKAWCGISISLDVIWLLSLVGMFFVVYKDAMYTNFKYMLPWSFVTLIICLSDVAMSIYFIYALFDYEAGEVIPIEVAEGFHDVLVLIFVPMICSKIGIIWICNIVCVVKVMMCYNELKELENEEAPIVRKDSYQLERYVEDSNYNAPNEIFSSDKVRDEYDNYAFDDTNDTPKISHANEDKRGKSSELHGENEYPKNKRQEKDKRQRRSETRENDDYNDDFPKKKQQVEDQRQRRTGPREKDNYPKKKPQDEDNRRRLDEPRENYNYPQKKQQDEDKRHRRNEPRENYDYPYKKQQDEDRNEKRPHRSRRDESYSRPPPQEDEEDYSDQADTPSRSRWQTRDENKRQSYEPYDPKMQVSGILKKMPDQVAMKKVDQSSEKPRRNNKESSGETPRYIKNRQRSPSPDRKLKPRIMERRKTGYFEDAEELPLRNPITSQSNRDYPEEKWEPRIPTFSYMNESLPESYSIPRVRL